MKNYLYDIENILGPNYNDLMTYAFGVSSWKNIPINKSMDIINKNLNTKIIDGSQTIIEGIYSLKIYFQKDPYFNYLLL